MKYFRIVSDYGYGNKSWIYRMIPENEIIDLLNKVAPNRECETIKSAEDQDYIYYIEEDSELDEEDWDWQDS